MEGIFELLIDENENEDINDSDDENDYEYKQMKTQISNPYNRLLPYTDELEQLRLEWFGNIKKHFFATICNDHVHHSLSGFFDSFIRYLEIYNFAFTKEDHIFMIKNLYISLKLFQNDLLASEKICTILSRLLRFPKTLSRNDLELDWRVLYSLFEEVHHSSAAKNGLLRTNSRSMSLLKRVVSLSRVYFSKNSTSEMLKEWKPYLCFDNKYFWQYLDYCSLFLPTLMYPEEHEFGYKLWLDDFIKLWSEMHSIDLRSVISKLFARLAQDAQGYIDWGPICSSSMFAEITSTKINPVQISVKISVFAKIIVHSISPNNDNISYLEQLFNILKKDPNSQLPSKFFGKLVTIIVSRYRKEQTDCWFNFTTKEHALNEDFLKKLGTLLFDSYFEIYFIGKHSALQTHLNALLLLNPEVYIDKIVEKLNFASEQISEPFRMVKALKIYSSSMFAIITDPHIGPKYRLQLIPNLLYLTETFNPYNDNLCFEQIVAIHSIVMLELPFIDCSSLVHSGLVMDQLEKEMCLQSSRLEEFPICFANKSISLIESNNERLFSKLQNNSMLLMDIWINIFSRTSAQISKRVVDKMFDFFKTHTCDGFGIVAQIFLKCCQQFYPGYTLEQNFPYIFNQLMLLIPKDKEKYSDSTKKELMYHLNLLRMLFYCDSQQLLPYQDQIYSLFKELIEIDIDSVLDCVKNTLQEFFGSLSVRPKLPAQQMNPDSILFKNWPKLIYPNQCALEWCQPDENSFKMFNRFFQTFFSDRLTRLEEWSESKIELSDDELVKNLRIIEINLFNICQPFVQSPSMIDSPTYLDNGPSLFFNNKLSGYKERVVIAVHKVLEKLKHIKSENTKAYKRIIYVYTNAMFRYLFPYAKFNSGHKRLYRKLAPRGPSLFYLHFISAKMNNNHVLQILHHELDSKFTSFHLVMIQDLLLLSVSSNPGTRNTAVKMVQYMIQKFNGSFEIVLDDIVDILKHVDDTNSIIGGLKLLHETSLHSLLLSSSWKVLLSLYPVLISLNLADKLEITDLIDKHFVKQFKKHFYTIPIERPHSFDAFISNFQEGISLGFEMISTEQIKTIEQKIIESNQANKKNYLQLIENILIILKEGNLHWRFHSFGIFLLNLLIRYDVDFPIDGIEFYVKNLINDLLIVRLTCRSGFMRILYKLKPKNIPIVVEVDQISSIDFKNLDCYQDENSFNSQIFLDQNYQGFFKSPFVIKKTGLVQNKAGFKCIADEFFKAAYLDKLFEFNSIEHKNRKDFLFQTDKFLPSDLIVWKNFFLVFKLYASEKIFAKIESSLEKRKASYDKFALEVLAGMIRVSNKFNFAEMCQLKAFIQRIIEKYYSNFDKESESAWKCLFISMFCDRDLKRYFWCFENLFKKIKLSIMTDYYQATCFQHISLAINNDWKYEHISRDFRSFILNNLDHPIYNVRISYGSALDLTFFETKLLKGLELNYEIMPVLEETIKASATDFEEKLSILFAKQGENDENMAIIKATLFDMDSRDGKKLLNSIETICQWISFALRTKEASEFFRFLPTLCVVQINEKNLRLHVKQVIMTLASINYPPKFIEEILASVRKISVNWNWHSRKTVLEFLTRFVSMSCFKLKKQPQSLENIIGNVIELLADTMIEVRNSACEALKTLVVCDLIDPQKRKDLIDSFKDKVNHRRIEIKHSGVLGLCAFVNSFPGEVPDFLPDILIFLAQHIQSSNIVSASAMTALRSFKKQHADNWIVYKQKFTADQLSELSDILISSSYYA